MRPHLKRLAALVAGALLLASCGIPRPQPSSSSSSGESAQVEVQVEPVSRVRVPWSAGDTLNPFTCTTLQNHYVAGLIYDSLVALDPVGTPQNRLAQEVTVEGSAWFVRLRTDAYFSDGARVTAADVVYSAQTAKASPRYAPQLSGLAGVAAADDYTVVFTLSSPDAYFDRSLSFPVVRLNTGELGIPMGGGRFVPDNLGTTLLRNDRYYDPVQNVQTVELLDVGTMEDQSYAITEKKLDLMYSDLRGETNLGLGTGRRQVVLNNLVFLGVNSKAWGFDSTARRAFSGLINREEIAHKAYIGFAAAAYSPIKPSFGTGTRTAAEEEVNPEKQNAILDQLGYGTRDASGYRTLRGKRFSLRLLVNSDNADRVSAAELVSAALRQGGVEVLLDKQPYQTYLQRIADGEYDLYLGEVRVTCNLDLSDLIAPSATLGPGCAWDQNLQDLYAGTKAGKNTLEELDSALRESMPLIPLVYRRGIVCFSRDFSANIVATEQDIFYNIKDW